MKKRIALVIVVSPLMVPLFGLWLFDGWSGVLIALVITSLFIIYTWALKNVQ